MTAKVQEIVGRFLLPEETQAIMDWITELGADPDLIVRAYEYARQRGATSHRYVSKVLIGWAENGIHTRQDADEYLAERDERHFVYRRIMQALGFSRNVTEEEARLIDEWVDELDCSMQQIMDACAKTAGIGNPNIKYVDAVLRNQKAGKGGQGGQSGQQEVSRNRVLAYYAHLREEAEERAEQARLDVYRRVPEIRQMDEQIAAASREMTNVMVQGGADKIERIQALRSRLQQTEQAKTRLMTERGIPIDIMNIRYRCPRCGDTGVLDNGARCDCYLEVVKEAADWHEEEK
jgi:DnaD/phage-associated family protein